MHYWIFWYVPFSCFRRDRHVSHHNSNLFMTCHVKLLIYIDLLCHLCYWNHRLQTVVHKMFIDTFNFYWYNYLLFDSWKKLPFKVIFVKLRFIIIDRISVVFIVGRSSPRCHKLNETAREFTTLGQSLVYLIKRQSL